MTQSSYEHLDAKLDTVIEKLGYVGADIATLNEQGRNTGERVGELASHVSKQNGRIRKLELWRSWMVGAAFVIGVVGKIIFDVFSK